MTKGRIILIALAVIIISYGISFMTKPSYKYHLVKLPATFEEFYQSKLKISKEKKVRDQNEELLKRYSKGKTDVAILYIHGFKASRKEGQYITDKIAKQFKANTYYMRLPGHGTNMEDHLNTKFNVYIDDVTDALLMMHKLGEKVFIIGTSTGGLLGTYLAAQYPDKVDGLILASPFYEFASPMAAVMKHYPLLWMYSKASSQIVDNSEVQKQKDNWLLYWYKTIYTMSIWNIMELKKYIAHDGIFEKVTAPVLMFYYYKDEKNQDATAQVSAMLQAYKTFGKGSKAHPLNKKVAIKNGTHVLMCHLYKAEWDKLEAESIDFIKKAVK